jgi:hypothetical protein
MLRSSATDLNVRLPAEARHNATASALNSGLYFDGLATRIFTFLDQQDPLSGVSTSWESPQPLHLLQGRFKVPVIA